MTETGLQPETLDLDPAPLAPANGPARDLMSKFDAVIAERQALLDTGVTDPFAIVMEEVRSPTEAVIKGRETILLGTYNYMGMTFDPDVIAAGKAALGPVWVGHQRQPDAQRHLPRPCRGRGGAARLLRHVGSDRLLDRVHGQSGHDLDAGRQG